MKPGSCERRKQSLIPLIRRSLLCAAVFLVACKQGSGDTQGAAETKSEALKVELAKGPTVADVVEGRRLYLSYGCVGCHGVNGGGGMGKPILDDEWIFGSDDETLFKLIRGQIPNQTMPNAIGLALTDDQIKKILLYVRSLYQGDASKVNWTVPPAVPAELLQADVSTGDPVAAGKMLFESACVPCHGLGGRGDGIGAAALDPKPRNLTDATYMNGLDDRYLFELVSRGGVAVGKSPAMPQFPLGRQDITNVIAYVRTLSKRQ
jgi:mono/diheme cytochrome c family protein